MGVAPSASAALLAALLIVPVPAAAEASIAVELDAVPPVYWLDDVEWQITVTNPGTEPLTAVAVDLTDLGAAVNPATLTGPVVTTGNADDVLDPGEEWSYGASAVHLPAGVGITVSATAPDTSLVTATDHAVSDSLAPVEIVVTADTTDVRAGETVTWDVSTRNLTSIPLLPPHNAEARILFPDWSGPIPYDELGEPVHKGTNLDDSLDPGETWVWRYSTAVTIDRSFLQVSFGVARPDSPLTGFGAAAQSAPITVTVPPPTSVVPETTTVPTPPTDGGLPETGADGGIALIAMLTLLAGSALLLVARQTSSTRGSRTTTAVSVGRREA